jgi:hypothetical protein
MGSDIESQLVMSAKMASRPVFLTTSSKASSRKQHDRSPAPREEREAVSYDGPIETGMVMVAPGNDGGVFRRDVVLCRHPFDEKTIILEGLPCRMRRKIGAGVGELTSCPESNLRYVFVPEDQFEPLTQEAGR